MTRTCYNIDMKPRYTSKAEWALYHKVYRAENADKIRAYKREYNRKWRKENGYHNERNSRKRYPEKEKARRTLNIAVQCGYVKKENCKKCGNEDSFAHHPDYSKPLSVIWLCRIHHAQEHKKKLTPEEVVLLAKLKEKTKAYKRFLKNSEKRQEEIRKLRTSGLSLRKIGIKFNISGERVRQICSRK